jgi:hypothetical protein
MRVEEKTINSATKSVRDEDTGHYRIWPNVCLYDD